MSLGMVVLGIVEGIGLGIYLEKSGYRQVIQKKVVDTLDQIKENTKKEEKKEDKENGLI